MIQYSEDLNTYNRMVESINALSDDELDKLIKEDKCPYQPELIPKSLGLGMLHCEICGQMVVAGSFHPRYSSID